MQLLDSALALRDAGCSVIPVSNDGTKTPAVAWKINQQIAADTAQLRDWFSSTRYDGLGVICGQVSGGLEMLEVEGRALHLVEQLANLMRDNGFGALWQRLSAGYLEQSPSGGMHWLYRVDGEVRGNTKLARRPGPADPVTGKPTIDVLIETRGEGGYTVVAPSARCTHPSGKPWQVLCGGPESIPTLTSDERDALYAIAAMLDEMPTVEPLERGPDLLSTGTRPGDDYNARAAWEDILTPHGWQRTKTFATGGYGWTRPGKNKREGISATTGTSKDGADRLYVFSSSTEFQTERPYSKFAAYALLEHGADHSKAASALRSAGYGAPPQPDAKSVATEPESPSADVPVLRQLNLTPASSIIVRPVHWLWAGRVALGTMALLGGREGIGKSTVGYTLAADVTRGRLPGEHQDVPKSVIVAATEDSWEHTIVPRLIAAGADLERVYRVDVTTIEGVDTGLSLPRDLHSLEDAVRRVDAALILLDPLMSRLDTKLDSHKDAEVRIALEPLVSLANRTGAAILGVIHVNKSTSTDPLTTLMASRAFAAVARAVLFVMLDPDDESMRLLGEPKNNLGRIDLPSLTFRIESAHVTDTPEGAVWTGRVNWVGEREQSIHELLEAAGETSVERSALAEAADWLTDYLASQGGTDDSASVKSEGRKAGHSEMTLKRARLKIKATTQSFGFPRRTYWALPHSQIAQSDQHPSESDMNELVQSDQQVIPLHSDRTGRNGKVAGQSPVSRARAQGESLLGPTVPYSETVGPDIPVGPVGPSPHAGARAREACTTCGWPTDSQGHAINCHAERR